jgi:parvulin-like peptidyl-prolyl isomerase
MRWTCHGLRCLLALPMLAAGCLSSPDPRHNPPGPPQQAEKAQGDAAPVVARLQRPEADSASRPVPAAPAAPSVADPSGLRPAQLTIRAWVNGKPIFDDELVQDSAADLFNNQRLPEPQRSARKLEIFKDHLQRLIDMEVVLQDAYRKLEKNKQALDKLKDIANRQFEKRLREIRDKLGSEDRFQEWLHIQNMTVDKLRLREERVFISQQYLYSRVGSTEDAVGPLEEKEYYDQHPNEFRTVDKVEWQDLFLAVGPKHPTLADARRFADQVVARLRRGESFATFQQYDDGVGASNHGLGIGQQRGQIQPREVEAYLWNMRDGEVGPPLELSTGVHVFRLVKRHHAGQLPFDEKVQAQIRIKLRNEIGERERKQIIRELTEHAIINVVSPAQSPLP